MVLEFNIGSNSIYHWFTKGQFYGSLEALPSVSLQRRKIVLLRVVVSYACYTFFSCPPARKRKRRSYGRSLIKLNFRKVFIKKTFSVPVPLVPGYHTTEEV